MRSILKLTIVLLISTACGSVKTTYIETKYEVCQDSCRLKYSKYENQQLNSCLAECSRDKYQK